MKNGARILTYSLVLAGTIAFAGVATANPSFARRKATPAVPTPVDDLTVPSSMTAKDAELARKEAEAQAKLDRANRKEISGKVVETMDANSYTYVLLEKEGTKTWIAMPEMKVELGQELTFEEGSEMWNFKSKSLGRTFDKIFFCNQPEKKVGSEADGSMAGKVSVGSAVAYKAPAEPIKVEKAVGKNAYTIADIYGSKASLDNKEIMVKGKVVKVSEGIMDKNWIHVQDGTGDAKLKNHNLVVTSQDLPKVGDVVVVNGTLKADKDFGGGYKYDVIIEEASIKK